MPPITVFLPRMHNFAGSQFPAACTPITPGVYQETPGTRQEFGQYPRDAFSHPVGISLVISQDQNGHKPQEICQGGADPPQQPQYQLQQGWGPLGGSPWTALGGQYLNLRVVPPGLVPGPVACRFSWEARRGTNSHQDPTVVVHNNVDGGGSNKGAQPSQQIAILVLIAGGRWNSNNYFKTSTMNRTRAKKTNGGGKLRKRK